MPPYRARHVYAGPYVDRASGLRKDPAWLNVARRDTSSRYVPVWRTLSLIDRARGPGAVLVSREVLASHAVDEPILLGRYRGATCFAIEVAGDHPPPLVTGAEFIDLRVLGGLLPPDEAGLLAYARAMTYWRARHRYCGACGSPTLATSAGHVMTCTRTACATEFFPRIDPAIIVLVTDGERALLGRQATWPPARYSTLAGFVEPGESLEDAVVREVREETSVEVIELDYHSSQPWPFPSSLMVGFEARADRTTPIVCADGELEDAKWFTTAEIASGTPALPPPQSISFRLIADWYENATGRPLEHEPRARLWSPPA